MKVLEKTLATERTHTVTMASLHEAAAAKPARWHHSLALTGVWAGALALAWFTWTGLKQPRWREQVGPEQLWTAAFPAPSACQTQPNPAPGVASLHSCSASGRFGEFGVTSFVLVDQTLRWEDDPAEADARMRAVVAETEQKTGLTAGEHESIERAGVPALEASFQMKQGPPLRALYIATGSNFYVLSTVGVTPEAELQFRQSFSVRPPQQ